MLLLLSVQVEYGTVDVVEQFGVVLDRSATAEEDDDLLFLLLHSPEEREQEDKSLVGITQHIALLEAVDSAALGFLVDIDIQRAGS